MANFPTSFETEPHLLQPTDLRPGHSESLSRLQSKGYVVLAGLDRAGVPGLTEIAQQEAVLEYCPNDLKRRWGDEAMAEKQLAKDGGRGVLRLVHRRTGETHGFGWTGRMSDEEREYLPMCENTFALRLHEAARGKKLGEPFSRVIVAGSMALWGARKIGLETWGSNRAAIHTYKNAGAEFVTTKDDVRPTRNPNVFHHGRQRNDIRIYMHFPWSAK